MDAPTEADIEAALDACIAAGLVEETDGQVRGTRKWSAKLQAAAEKINLLAADQGRNPDGNPLVLAVSQALANENLFDAARFPTAVHVMVMVELTRLPPEKRSQLGFGHVAL